MFKHCLLALSLAALSYAAAPVAIAQDAGNTQAQPAPEHGRHHFDPARRAEMLGKQLSLTSDQQAKVLDILKSEQSEMKSLHSDTSLSREDRHSKMMDLHQTSNDQIRALLTPDQQKKFDEILSRHEHWGHHPENSGGSASPQQ